MATAATLTSVKLQLPDEALSMGLDDTAIAGFIVTFATSDKVLLACWRVIAGKAATITDVSESGSSRQIPLFDRAKQMIDFYQQRSDAEDQQASLIPVRAHGASLRAVRV